MTYNRKDFFFHQAKKENYVARSVFKLEEIDRRYKVLKSNYKILDLGAAPGSWSQFSSKRIGPKGRVLGIDIQPVKLTLPNAIFITADLRDVNLEQLMTEHGIKPPFDVVLSDMAPRTSGIRFRDQMRSLELCELALECAEKYLKKGGVFICKMFHSEEFEDYRTKLRARFSTVDTIRPESTRKESKEIFFVALDFKGAAKK